MPTAPQPERDPVTPDDDIGASVASLYDPLREIARRVVGGRTGLRMLEPTELVHELFIRLARGRQLGLDRAEILALAAKVLRSVLVDHARQLRALKRGGGRQQVTLDGQSLEHSGEIDVLVLDEALSRLSALDPRMARAVELRFFGGLESDEVARLLGVSPRTVNSELSLARAWLHRELAP
jgi:RNA polymerase sigma factor (TIGR02999 family)